MICCSSNIPRRTIIRHPGTSGHLDPPPLPFISFHCYVLILILWSNSTHVTMLQKRHDADNRGPEVETVIISFLVLSWVTVLARCWVRIRMIKAFAWDDWLTVLTLQIFTIYCSFVLVGAHWGCGRHMHDLTVKQRVKSMRVSLLSIHERKHG